MDETETHMSSGQGKDEIIQTEHFLMLHVDIFASHGVRVHNHSVAVPPIFIVDQSTESVLEALHIRLGSILWAPRVVGGLRALIINSDSHGALVRLAKHFSKLYREGAPAGGCDLILHARCQMHQFFLSCSHGQRFRHYRWYVLLHAAGPQRPFHV